MLAINWISARYGLAIRWLWSIYQLAMGWPWAGHGLAISELWTSCGLAMAWLWAGHQWAICVCIPYPSSMGTVFGKIHFCLCIWNIRQYQIVETTAINPTSSPIIMPKNKNIRNSYKQLLRYGSGWTHTWMYGWLDSWTHRHTCRPTTRLPTDDQYGGE